MAAIHEAVEHHRQARPVIQIKEIIDESDEDDENDENAGAIPVHDVAQAEAPVEVPAAPLAIEAPPRLLNSKSSAEERVLRTGSK